MIELERVTVEFSGTVVLGPIDLSLDAGVMLGLIGPPGSGKSLLLKVIAGLIRPSSGRVRVLGEELGLLDERAANTLRRRLGMVFQNNALFDSKTIFDNVAFPLRGRDANEIREKVLRRVKDVGLAGNEALFPHELSGGMQKRAGIARATVDDPPIRLYDEPTAGLDPVTSARILALIAAIHEKAPGVSIIISNEMDSMLKVVPEVLMLHKGAIIFRGPRSTLDTPEAPELARTFVAGDTNANL